MRKRAEAKIDGFKYPETMRMKPEVKRDVGEYSDYTNDTIGDWVEGAINLKISAYIEFQERLEIAKEKGVQLGTFDEWLENIEFK